MTAYATTDPPANSRILPYTKTAPYVLVTISVALALQCIVIGSASLLVLHNATARWCREVSRSPMLDFRRMCDILITISYTITYVTRICYQRGLTRGI